MCDFVSLVDRRMGFQRILLKERRLNFTFVSEFKTLAMNPSFTNSLKVVYKNTKAAQLSMLKVAYKKASQNTLQIV